VQKAAWIILAALGLSSSANAQSAPPAAPSESLQAPEAAPADSAIPSPPETPLPAVPAALPPAPSAPPSAAEQVPPMAASPVEADADTAADSSGVAFGFHARVMTGVEVVRVHPKDGQLPAEETQTGLFLDEAVLDAEARISKRIDLEVGFNLESTTLRDAYVNVRVEDALQLRAGRFKRPFSRLELRSIGKLPFRSRGLYNSLVLRDGNFAGRTLAGMVWGKPIEQLRYFVALASPAPLGSDIEGLDAIGRVVYDPSDAISFGANAMYKWSERAADGAPLRVAALGVDSKLDFGALSVSLEFDAAQNPNPPPTPNESDVSRTPWALGAIGYADYKFKLSKKWTFSAIGVLEWLDTDIEYGKDERVRAVGGLSWNYDKNALRVMPQVELTRPLGGADPRGEVASETYYLLVSAEI
jgi:hypothetical protein